MNRLNCLFDQPAPRALGITKELVRLHAGAIYRNKLEKVQLTHEDWLQAELEIVQQ